MKSEAELVLQAVRGRVAATEELVRRWAPRVTAFCHAKVGSGQASEDLAQEALMRAIRSLATLQAPEKFGTWLFGIAHRVCLDWINRKERSHVTFGALGNPEELISAEPPSEKGDQVQALLAAVEALPQEYREVLMLYYYNDVRYSDLAKLLGVSSATINLRLTRARQMLRQRLKGEVHGL